MERLELFMIEETKMNKENKNTTKINPEDEVLMTITRKHLNTGMRDYPVGTVYTSWVDPVQGVRYVGYPVDELKDQDPEKVIFLLLYKHWPSEWEIAKFRQEMIKRSEIPYEVVNLIKVLPLTGRPMKWFMAGLTYLSMLVETGDYVEDGLNLIAKANGMAALVYRLRSGWGHPIPSEPERGYVENFVHMLGCPNADQDKLTRALRNHYVLHMDHGGGNCSTFTGKAAASGLTDIYSSIVAAMASLYGPRHGRASERCFQYLLTFESHDPDYITDHIEGELAEGKLIYGFGHAVLRDEDPRAKVLYELAEELFPNEKYVKLALKLRELVPNILKQSDKIQNPYPNVDAISGAFMHAAGLTDPTYYTLLFGFSRVAGIVAQIIDERIHMRDGKGVPIYRCKYPPEDKTVKHLKA